VRELRKYILPFTGLVLTGAKKKEVKIKPQKAMTNEL
jgi:hypothetical protein